MPKNGTFWEFFPKGGGGRQPNFQNFCVIAITLKTPLTHLKITPKFPKNTGLFWHSHLSGSFLSSYKAICLTFLFQHLLNSGHLVGCALAREVGQVTKDCPWTCSCTTTAWPWRRRSSPWMWIIRAEFPKDDPTHSVNIVPDHFWDNKF